MTNLSQFFESSTIHGLAYWTKTRRWGRCFWMTVVFGGFVGAGIIINQSFQSWENSPISTTIETRPISEVTFPKITVCPPRNSYTNLNYDLMSIDKNPLIPASLSDYIEELSDNFVQHFLNLDYEQVMKNLRQSFQEKDRFRNWYHGNRYRY